MAFNFSLDSSPEMAKTSPIVLTQEQKLRMETNRKRALDTKKSKENEAKIQKLMENSSEPKRLIDTGAGFYLDEDDLEEEKKKESEIITEPSVPIPSDFLKCDRCSKRFPHSFLSQNFSTNICDCCKMDFPDDYKLITKSEASAEYLLKDCDLNLREPPLKFMSKKNPHHKGWGEMKLYLRKQVIERAIMVHEDLEKIEEKKEVKVHNLQKTRQKNYEKQVKTLRAKARLGARKTVQYHEHEFGEGVYNEDEDNYCKTCKTCDFQMEYEEL